MHPMAWRQSMEIKIASRLHPFSHVPGALCLIPKSQWTIQVFPTLLRFKSMSGEQIEHPLPLRGPVKNFTVEQDLEKGGIEVFGETPDGFIRYRILREEKEIVLLFDKKKVVICPDDSPKLAETPERLSLGMHRSQEWEMVHRRQDLGEIFPAWLRLAQLTPAAALPKSSAGNFTFLEECRNLIQHQKKEEIVPAFINFFNAGFHGILVPRLVDDQHQGLTPAGELPAQTSSLPLLTEGGKLIRSLFISESKEGIAILPCLPPEFHAGRLTHIKLQNGDELDIEWSKKLLRRAIYRSLSGRPVQLILQKPLHNFRLRRSLKDKGQNISRDEPIPTTSGETLFLDRFQK
jgi:hypothetical protein